MNTNNHVFFSWEERRVSKEKGPRVVHYYLKDSLGKLLAVVGTEKSAKHMIYVVTNDYLDAFGHTSTINSETKWRAKRDVVGWLTSLISEPHRSSPISNTPASEKKRSASTAGHISDEASNLPSKSKPKISNILWSGTAWTCAKRLKHYPSFSTKGITITVNSFAIIKAEEEGHYLAYLDDFYENKKGEKSVKVRWFQHLQEVQCVIPQLEGHPGEIFITPHTQVIYAECIDALATVLTPEDYERYISLAPENLLSGVYVCCWEFKNNKVMPFSVSELDGYYNQTIFTMLSNHQAQLKSKGPMSHEIKDITREDPIKQGPRGSRSVGGSRSSGIRKSIPGNQLAKATPPTCAKLKTKIPSSGPAGIQLVEPQFKLSFEVGDNLEVLRLDSGLRGCWFRCKVLKVSEKCLKVQYDDIQDYDGPDKMKEWVSSYRVADSDKLGMRCTGRLTIRPRPPEDFSDCSFEVGAAVDAWWSDGWWEGVVVDFDVYGSGHLQVFFPGENRLLEIPKKNVRISRDWIDNKWVEVNGKKDIMSFISSSLNDVSKCSINEPGNCKNQMAPKLVASEDKKMASTSEHLADKQATDVLKLEDKQATNVLKLKKRWSNDFLAAELYREFLELRAQSHLFLTFILNEKGVKCKEIILEVQCFLGKEKVNWPIPRSERRSALLAGKQIATAKLPNYPKLKVKFPSSGPAGIQLVESQHKLSFEAGDNIEVLCKDSGMRGCWFRCKILRVSEKRLKVQYDDILDCDGPEKLEEWIPSYRVANPDKLGTRCRGRLTVRPRPLEGTTTLYLDL
ncbi:hypothetical protein CQW23_27265 [Capsicum baccatum]|uniref:BAH domain-containing protein n=1 Tax=Capsicum baccatum TaxID=33114 RepID=A0A2G2VDB8_CAPBA|nr:hypothetical protein CQW23_27265 [Capsicum baccatum]